MQLRSQVLASLLFAVPMHDHARNRERVLIRVHVLTTAAAHVRALALAVAAGTALIAAYRSSSIHFAPFFAVSTINRFAPWNENGGDAVSPQQNSHTAHENDSKASEAQPSDPTAKNFPIASSVSFMVRLRGA